MMPQLRRLMPSEVMKLYLPLSGTHWDRQWDAPSEKAKAILPIWSPGPIPGPDSVTTALTPGYQGLRS